MILSIMNFRISCGYKIMEILITHPNIVKRIKEKGLSCSLWTNATLLDEHNSRELIKLGIDHIGISLDGIDRVYERVRGYPYKEVEKNILRF